MQRAALPTLPGLMVLGLSPFGAMACERPVCLVPEGLVFSDEVSFRDRAASLGPGQPVSGVLVQPGAQFGKAFAGQVLGQEDGFDRVAGAASAPLTLLAGEEGRNLSVIRVGGDNLLTGDGPAGRPRTGATGEGAIAIRLDQPQSALALDLMGAEGGEAMVQFLDAAGAVIDSHRIGALAEGRLTFQRAGGSADIAGVVLTSADTEGIALLRVAFGLAARTS